MSYMCLESLSFKDITKGEYCQLTRLSKTLNSPLTVATVVNRPRRIEVLRRLATFVQNVRTVSTRDIKTIEDEPRLDASIAESRKIFVYALLDGEAVASVRWQERLWSLMTGLEN